MSTVSVSARTHAVKLYRNESLAVRKYRQQSAGLHRRPLCHSLPWYRVMTVMSLNKSFQSDYIAAYLVTGCLVCCPGSHSILSISLLGLAVHLDSSFSY